MPSKHRISKFTYTCKDSPNSTVDQHVFVGVDIGSKLTWTPYLNASRRANQTLILRSDSQRDRSESLVRSQESQATIMQCNSQAVFKTVASKTKSNQEYSFNHGNTWSPRSTGTSI